MAVRCIFVSDSFISSTDAQLCVGYWFEDANVKLPVMKLQAPIISPEGLETENIDNLQINPSCLLSYLGIRGIGWRLVTGGGANGIRSFNGVPLLMYWDIVKNYYINKQEPKAFVIHSTPVLPLPYIDKIDWEAPWITGTGVYPEGLTYPASKLLGYDTYFIVTYNNTNINWEDIMLIDKT